MNKNLAWFCKSLLAVALLMSAHGECQGTAQNDTKTTRSPKVVYEIPQGFYKYGKQTSFKVNGRAAFMVEPTGEVDAQRRWVMVAPLGQAMAGAEGAHYPYEIYVDALLKAGFHVGGVDVGMSCGSPKGAEVQHAFYEEAVKKYKVNPKARAIGQSNGGLIIYAWAFRHPECVDKIFGVYPVTDMSTWPKLEQVVGPKALPEPELSFGVTLDELRSRLAEFNPIDNLEPMVKAGVRIFHIVGDKDVLVPWHRNSVEFIDKYKALGGDGEYELYPDRGHGASGEEFDKKLNDEIFYKSQRGIDFLLK